MRLKQEVEEKIKQSIQDANSLLKEYRMAVENEEIWFTESEITSVLKEISKLKEEIDLLQDAVVETEFAKVCECGDMVKGECGACEKAEHEDWDMREEALRS